MSLDQPSDSWQELRETAGAVLENWRSELGALLGPNLRQIFEPSEKPAIVDAGDPLIVVSRELEGNVFELGRIEASADDAAGRLAAIAASIPGASVILRLPQQEVLRPKLQLPYASPRILEQALSHELVRVSPIDPALIYFDYAIVSRDRKTNKSELELRIIKRSTVDRAIALCRDAGLSVGAIAFEDDARHADWRRFPLDRTAFLRLLWQRWSIALLSGLAVLLLLATLLAAYARGAATQDAISDELAFTQARASVIERLQQKIDVIDAEGARLARERQQPLFVSVLAGVSQVLPDGSWITELTLSGNKVRLQGYARSAADLIALFDKSPMFTNAQFQAPLTRDTAQNIDHFDLGFEVRGFEVRGFDVRGKTP